MRLKISLILLPPSGKRQSAANQAADVRVLILAPKPPATDIVSLDAFAARPYA
jgi:hypothetical protein